MPRAKKKPEQSRCERCLKLFAPDDLCLDVADLSCVECLGAPVQKGRPVAQAPITDANAQRAPDKAPPAPNVANALVSRLAPPAETHGRCERCMRLTALVEMHQNTKNEHVCSRASCSDSDKVWFAVALVGSESKTAKLIRERATKNRVRHMLGRIVSPKTRVASQTKTSWAAYTEDDELLGHVTAEDHEEALYLAKQKFEPRSQKGVFKPEHRDVFIPTLARVLRTVERTKEKGRTVKRTVYTAYDDQDHVLGRILGAKSPQHATEIATRLYTPKDDKPKTAPVVQGFVDRVEVVREGGTVKVQNRRAMKGYLLVECQKNDHVLSSIRSTKGVYSVLPFTEKVTAEQIERDGLPDYPSGLSREEVEKHTVKPKDKPLTVKYKTGDRVTIVQGPFTDQTCEVIAVLPQHEKVTCAVKVFGRPSNVTFDVAQVRKN